jgi:hypothetical protein
MTRGDPNLRSLLVTSTLTAALGHSDLRIKTPPGEQREQGKNLTKPLSRMENGAPGSRTRLSGVDA